MYGVERHLMACIMIDDDEVNEPEIIWLEVLGVVIMLSRLICL